jgi:hypothetical protein
MNKLLAVIALLCLSSTVQAHDIYSNLRDREGHLCCGGQDCKPVQATVLPNGNYYLPETGETISADMTSHLTVASTSVSTIQYGKAHPRLDASLLRCILRSGSARAHAAFLPQTAKCWPGFRHKPRNEDLCDEIRLKQVCGRC